jgi:hypothetical protein
MSSSNLIAWTIACVFQSNFDLTRLTSRSTLLGTMRAMKVALASFLFVIPTSYSPERYLPLIPAAMVRVLDQPLSLGPFDCQTLCIAISHVSLDILGNSRVMLYHNVNLLD